MTEQQRKDMDKMQADAIRRMRDMNSKSTNNHTNSIPPAPNFLKMNTGHTNKEQKHEANHASPAISKSKGFNLLKMLNLENFKMDSDFTIIIAMILLLSSEESDEILLLALLYIML